MVKPGIYRHFKGGVYEVLYNAKHTETGETLIIYRSTSDPDMVWARPLSMWDEKVSRDGYDGPRFIYLASEIKKI